jgi:hypothetical protein
LDLRGESDGIYWDVIDVAHDHFGIRDGAIDDTMLSRFGHCPYAYEPPLMPSGFIARWKFARSEPWRATHSMHPPEDVRKLAAELKAARSAYENADGGMLAEYEEELLPVIERVANEGRMLLVDVDT